ncbi:unnamed protein product [Bursaphelenchus okinawaensis]|uniref:Uncharacterized protein n=1 Tax=Bursaphelenchus okinawaensis TaxID=465554 RepID=A0A811K7M4_9BILA|nr:unnamed protein product [Bursaphelenchus okinawaensis]CAG9094303.1 unnamed protein product [Bursaphelenchus okinawaensis]
MTLNAEITHQNKIKRENQERKVNEQYRQLKSFLNGNCNYWAAKAKLLTAQADKTIPAKLIKSLELEMALKHKSVKDVVGLTEYLYKMHGDEVDFRKLCTEKINSAMQNNKGTKFLEELQNSLNPNVFLDPLLQTHESSFSRIKKLVLLAMNPSVGFKKVGRALYDQYISERAKLGNNFVLGTSPLDLIWFHLHKHLMDQNLGDYTKDEALFVQQLLLKCCVADAAGLLKESFFDVINEFGFAIPRLKDSWTIPLKLCCCIFSQEQPSQMAKLMSTDLESSSYVQISEALINNVDVHLDLELSKFLIQFATFVHSACEEDGIFVCIPGNVTDMSLRAIETYWKNVVMQSKPGPIKTKKTLGAVSRLYEDALTVARNVFKAFQKYNNLQTVQIEPNLRNILLLDDVKNGFHVVAQALMVGGEMELADKFIKLSIQTTKNSEEQKLLDVQLLQVNVSLRRYTSALKIFVDLFENESEVSKVLDGVSSVFPDIVFDENTLILLPKDQLYVYIVIIFMHTIFLILIRSITLDRIKHVAASLILLSMQICYEAFDDHKICGFLQLCERCNLYLINIASLILKEHLAVHIVNSKAKCLQGGSDMYETSEQKRAMMSMAKRPDSATMNRLTPYRNVIVFLKEFKAVFTDL